MNEREQRGILIAATSRITRKGSVWLVPSQTVSPGAKYTVCPDEQSPHCTCPDHETRGVVCKHIYAVQCVIRREQSEDGTETLTQSVTVTETIQRKTYPQKWRQYNAAQCGEKDKFQTLLRSLCDMVKEPAIPAGRGRPRIAMSDSIFMACFKVYSTVSGRRFMCDLDDAREKGYIEKTPHFNSIFNALENPELAPILAQLIIASSLPLREVEQDFAIDSSGFTSSRFHRWFDHKYGKERQEHDWVKAHIVCGVKTNVVVAVEIHDRNTNDCPLLPSLLETAVANGKVRELSADKGYTSEANFQALAKHEVAGFIPFRCHTTGGIGGLFAKAFHYFSLCREEFLEHYHKRSNVESTFSMMKAKFGDAVRSKTDVAMKNEVLCKILCHNICCLISAMYELGITPVFQQMLGCTQNTAAAH
ncbi:MAG: transposase [Planctomycetaceae bacterium]|nr:transposase [Planctomycetaceae bacterium]